MKLNPNHNSEVSLKMRTFLVEITLKGNESKEYLSNFGECDDIEKVKIIKEVTR